jgi:pilus assembly protein CpaF
MSFEIILPFLRPIASFIEDADVSEVMVNAGGRVFVERHGLIVEAERVQISEKNLQVAVRNIARLLGDDVSEEQPILDARLPDGSRVAAVIPPCSLGGTTLTIRKFQSRFFSVDDLVRTGTLTTPVVDALRGAINARQTILISGGTSTGKTTLLNALAALLPPADRIVLIEDTAELRVDQPNVVRFEARRAQRGLPSVTIRDLLKAPAGPNHRGGSARRRSLRPLAGTQHRPRGYPVHDSREFSSPGAGAPYLVRTGSRR